MRPNWQVFLARELTARAQPSTVRDGVVVAQAGTPGSHMVGALIVRNLVAMHPELSRVMLTVPQEAQDAWVEAEWPPELVWAMDKMWASVGVYASGHVDANRTAAALWMLARVAFLSLPPQEIAAAEEIAKRSQPLPWHKSQAVKSETGREELLWGEGWEDGGWDETTPEAPAPSTPSTPAPELDAESTASLSGFLGFGAVFGGLRDELLSSAPNEAQRQEFARIYDGLVSSTSERRRWVTRWQTWAKGRGFYTGVVDGLWGPKSEAAWDQLAPMSYGQPTRMGDIRAVMAYGSPELEAVAGLAAGIVRDRWLPSNMTRLPPPPPSVAETPPTPSTPEAEDGGVTVTPVSEEEVVIHPEEEETGEPPPAPPTRVQITPLPGWETGPESRVTIIPVEEPGTTGAGAPVKATKRSWTPLLVGLGATALVVGAVVLSGKGKKQPYEEG